MAYRLNTYGSSKPVAFSQGYIEYCEHFPFQMPIFYSCNWKKTFLYSLDELNQYDAHGCSLPKYLTVKRNQCNPLETPSKCNDYPAINSKHHENSLNSFWWVIFAALQLHKTHSLWTLWKCRVGIHVGLRDTTVSETGKQCLLVL